jgi:hypothetical protein
MGRRVPRADWPAFDPCPWCGVVPPVGDVAQGGLLYLWRAPDVRRGSVAPSATGPWFIVCGGCQAKGPHARDRGGAISKWNSRRVA